MASINTRSGKKVRSMLREALANAAERARGSSKAEGQATHDKSTAPESNAEPSPPRFEDRFPVDGLVLQVLCKDLPRPDKERPRLRDWRRDAWNLDWAWFKQDELQRCIPEPERGAVQAMPEHLALRLARLHLLDTVRGQTSAYKRKEVKQAQAQFRVTDIAADILILEITGTTRAERTGNWPTRSHANIEGKQQQGVACALRGTARWNTKDQRFEAFELIGKAERWGATQFNGRGDDVGTSPVGFVFRMIDNPPHVAPANWWQYGWSN